MFNLTVSEAHTYYVGQDGWLVHNTGPCFDYGDLFTKKDIDHILYGDGPTSGGHMWPGNPGKTVFPQSWDGNKILTEVADIATNPKTQWYSPNGKADVLTKAGDPQRWISWETRGGVQMRVVYEPKTGRVITAFPDPKGPGSGVKPIK